MNRRYELRSLNTTVRASNADKGSFDLTMIVAYVRYVARLLWLLVAFRPRLVIYCPTSATLLGWVRDGTTLLLAPLLGGRVVLQFRGGHFRSFFDGLAPLPRSLIGWSLRRSSLVLAQAEPLKKQFAGLVPPERIGRLYNAIPRDFFDHFEGVDRGAHGGDVTVLFVGHLSQAKGYCDLLRAIPALCSRHRVRFRCMGAPMAVERNVFYNQVTGERLRSEDPAACYRDEIERRGLASRVELLGAGVHGADKLAVFRGADIFVLPSYSEGFSRAVLEAMAAGLPSVVTCVGAVPEIMTDGVTGFVIPPGDGAALLDRLDRLVADAGLRRSLGAAARERCREQFLPEGLAQSLIAQLERIA